MASAPGHDEETGQLRAPAAERDRLREGRPAEGLGVFDVLLGTGLGGDRRETDVAAASVDTLLLHTDGAVDTPGTDGRFGERRLRSVAAAGPWDRAPVLERDDAATGAWRSGRAVDGRAMLAVQLVQLRDA